MSAFLSPVFGAGAQAFTNQGIVLAGGKIYTYVAGSTTQAATWTTSSQAIQNANPLILDSAGRVPQEVWLQSGASYKFVLQDSNSNVLGTWDNITGINDSSATVAVEWLFTGLIPTYISGTQFSVLGNQTGVYTVNRRIQVSVNAGTLFGYVVSSSFGGGITTITVTLDSGVLDVGLSAANVGLLGSISPSVPHQFITVAGGTLTGSLIFKAGLNNIASAATVDLTAATSNTAHITGTTGISAFTMTSGQVIDLVFDGALTLTHHATNNNLPGGVNITTAAGDRARYWYDGTTRWCVGYQRADGTPVSVVAAHGQCVLSKSGANLILLPKNGNGIVIGGVLRQIPSAGVTLAPFATDGTNYLIYAAWSGSAIVLTLAVGGSHTTDTATGVETKTGDLTATLVGQARTVSSAWVDSISQRFVRSWFNRPPVALRNAFTALRSTVSQSAVEINTEIRCAWLQWADEVPTAHIQGSANNDTANISTITAIGWDGTVDANTYNSVTSASGLSYNCSTSAPKEGLAEGYHYATLMGLVSAASTGYWTSGITGIYTSLSVRVGS